MKKRIIIQLISVIFASIFLYSGVIKIIKYGAYVSQLREYPFMTSSLIRLSWTVPSVELITSILFICYAAAGLFQSSKVTYFGFMAFYASLLLLIGFTVFLIYLSTYPFYLPCSCGGILEKLPTPLHIILNGFLIILAILAISLEKKVWKKKATIIGISNICKFSFGNQKASCKMKQNGKTLSET